MEPTVPQPRSDTRREVASALRRSEQRYRSLVAATALIVWTTTPDGMALEDSPSWRATTGQTLAEWQGWGWLDALHPDDRGRTARAWSAAVDAREEFVHPYRLRRADGRYRLVESRGVPIVENGQVVEWVGTCTDITDEAAASAALTEAVRLARVAADRTLRLQRATSMLSRAVTLADVGAVVLEHGAAELHAAGCGVFLLDEGTPSMRAIAMQGYPTEIVRAWSAGSLEEDDYITDAVRRAEPVFVNDADELLSRYSSPRLRASIAASGNRSWCALPLTTTGAPTGVLSFGFPQARAFDHDERTFLVALAAQCAQAVSRAQLYERQAGTALLLQQSLLPADLPQRPGLATVARYRPATADVEVGGDWYDVFELPGGRTGVALGDVMGKGVPAATVMGEVRNVLRGYAYLDPSPATVLRRLDGLFERFDPEQLTTVVYGVYDPADRSLVWCNAGHLPPLLVVDGTAEYLDHQDTPLGVGGVRTEQRSTLPPGALLLLCSDGLVERRTESIVVGLEQLRACLSAPAVGPCTLDLEAAAERVLTTMLPDGCHTDDVTMLLLRTSREDG